MGSISVSRSGPEVFDVRQNEIKNSILDDINAKLRPANGAEKQLPTMLLYDERGLKLFEQITYLDEYYLTASEIEILDRYAHQIADRIPSGAVVVELGSGNLRKIRILLQALDNSGKEVDYYALDLSLSELDRTLGVIPPFRHVKCRGLHGTYDDALHWLKLPSNRSRPKVILSLGSSIGNFDRRHGATFLSSFVSILQPSDAVFIGVDGCLDTEAVYHAYNDKYGVTHAFYRNGLEHANRILGFELFKQTEWDIVGEFNARHGRHEAFVFPKKDIHSHGFSFGTGERIRFESSYKYSPSQRLLLWNQSGLALRASYLDKRSQYSLNLLSPAMMPSSFDPSVYAASRVPSLEEFRELWKIWILVSQLMLPRHEVLSKPIHLRNCCIFYLGHIPTFLDIHLTRATHGKPTEPASYQQIFERGIDPDVDNPEHCHAHSEIPDSWPAIEEILEYQGRVRDRVISLYKSGLVYKDPTVGKAVWLGFEHEAMHIETFLYMLLQSDKTLPPPGVKPDFEALAHEAHNASGANPWIKVPQKTVTIGMDEDSGIWGWDVEKPARTVAVQSFEAKARPLTNGDYARYLVESGYASFPKSWIVEPSTNGKPNDSSQEALINGYSDSVHGSYLKGKAVRTVYGPVPLVFALDWPVMGSYDELASCADWLGGRIPTMEEAQSIYAHVEELNRQNDPAVQKTHNGIHSPGTVSSHELYMDLRGHNVSFANFHPTPVSLQKDKLAGLSGMGGVWEWTSSVLTRWDGYEAMYEYPGYSSDFFDDKHNIVLGGSWATHSRLAGRKSFVNWYQRNYPYAWVGARMVRDTPSSEEE